MTTRRIHKCRKYYFNILGDTEVERREDRGRGENYPALMVPMPARPSGKSKFEG
jgi:hypothetical protein